MICYRDRTYCEFYLECGSGEECTRALTPEVRKAANYWWRGIGGDAPICVYSEHPECFVEKKEIEEDEPI